METTNTQSKVNLVQINKKLEALGAKYKILNPEATRFDVLHAKTESIIFVASQEHTCSEEVAILLIELWFPGLYMAQDKTGKCWEHFWALDIKVYSILFEAGYRIGEEDCDEEGEEEEEAEEEEEKKDYDEIDDEKVVEEMDQIRLWEQQELWLHHQRREEEDLRELGKYWQTHKTKDVASDPRLENLSSAIKAGVFDDVEDVPPPQSPGLYSDLPIEEKKAILAWDLPVDYVSDQEPTSVTFSIKTLQGSIKEYAVDYISD